MKLRRRPRPVIRDGHHSGRFTATRAQWQRLCDVMADHCDRWSTTECGGKIARAALADWCREHGWDLVHPGGWGNGECAILSRPAVLRLLETDDALLTHETLTSARKAPLHAPIGRFHLLGTPLRDWRSVAHLPAHLEGLHGFQPGRPAHVHASAVHGWKKAMHGRTPKTLMFDANVNRRLPWVRDWAAHTFPSLRSAWGRHLPAWGTFHRRVIDLVQSDLRRKGRVRRIPHVPGFDHTGFAIHLTPRRHLWRRLVRRLTRHHHRKETR